MATSLTNFNVLARLTCELSESFDDSHVLADTTGAGLVLEPATLLSNGTTANKADRLVQDRDRELGSGNTRDLDMYSIGNMEPRGTGLDLLGNTVTLAEVVTVLIYNHPGDSAGNLLVGGKGDSTAWNSPFNGDDDAVMVAVPGGWLMLHAPTDPAYAVADGSNHILQLEASGGDVTYDIAVLGRSA